MRKVEVEAAEMVVLVRLKVALGLIRLGGGFPGLAPDCMYTGRSTCGHG